MTHFVQNDGGRKAAGYRGDAGDCACRAIAIATGRPYKEVYDLINEFAKDERYKRGKVGFMAATKRGSSARDGVLKKTFKEIMEYLGAIWVPTIGVGVGCKVHLRADELPKGRLLCVVSGHYVAVIDGIIHDTYDPSREGTRCVYGYYVI